MCRCVINSKLNFMNVPKASLMNVAWTYGRTERLDLDIMRSFVLCEELIRVSS